MSKKFDVVIGNPPYQEEAQGEGTRDTPVYHLFMDAAYEVGKKAVLITPARFLFNAGFTPKAWNEKMLADQHLTVAALRVRQSTNCFRASRTSRAASPSPTATRSATAGPSASSRKYPELNTILHKVLRVGQRLHRTSDITSSRSYRYTQAKLYEDNPEASALRPAGNAALVSTNAFEQFSFLYPRERARRRQRVRAGPRGDRKKRALRWIRSEYIAGPESFNKYKVVGPGGERVGVDN